MYDLAHVNFSHRPLTIVSLEKHFIQSQLMYFQDYWQLCLSIALHYAWIFSLFSYQLDLD